MLMPFSPTRSKHILTTAPHRNYTTILTHFSTRLVLIVPRWSSLVRRVFTRGSTTTSVICVIRAVLRRNNFLHISYILSLILCFRSFVLSLLSYHRSYLSSSHFSISFYLQSVILSYFSFLSLTHPFSCILSLFLSLFLSGSFSDPFLLYSLTLSFSIFSVSLVSLRPFPCVCVSFSFVAPSLSSFPFSIHPYHVHSQNDVNNDDLDLYMSITPRKGREKENERTCGKRRVQPWWMLT